ncbi:homoserine kinase [Bacillus spongiae]|uniref:Homoserine kinase n=1 Tax=Bacillus spongiae TaxID=2683610 RepID=A0ABU8HBN6_9BACI
MKQANWRITVPASTANVGPGFDSIGLALSLYLNVNVYPHSHWEVRTLSPKGSKFPNDETHYMIQVAKEIAKRFSVVLQPYFVEIDSDIPLAQGFGSSGAVVLAGIELVDVVGGLQLTLKQKHQLAAEFEGHPDNVGASLYGGLVVCCQLNEGFELVSYSDFPLHIVTVSPQFEMKTKESRAVLPKVIDFDVATKASAISNMMLAALWKRDWELFGELMSQDLFHQPYRKLLIPYFEEVENVAKQQGACGVAISGAGPTIACFVKREASDALREVLQQYFKKTTVRLLKVEEQGIQSKLINR